MSTNPVGRKHFHDLSKATLQVGYHSATFVPPKPMVERQRRGQPLTLDIFHRK